MVVDSFKHHLVLGSSCGLLKGENISALCWHSVQDKHQINAPGPLSCAKLLDSNIAVGGKDLNLRIWDVNNPKQPIFTAKNPRPTTLELPVPIWISDISYVSKYDGRLIVTASKHGELDLYDTRCNQRRPVSRNAWRMSRKHGNLKVGLRRHSATLPDLNTTRPITKALAYDNGPGMGIRIVAGNVVGELCFVDLRLPKEYLNFVTSDQLLQVKSLGVRAPVPPANVRTLAGASGCITGLVCGGADRANIPSASFESQINQEPTLIVSSLDRFLRFYNRDSGERLAKIYVKVPITSFLVHDDATCRTLKQSTQEAASDNKHTSTYDKTNQIKFDALWNQIQDIHNDDNCIDDAKHISGDQPKTKKSRIK